jgi:hypothetical protein
MRESILIPAKVARKITFPVAPSESDNLLEKINKKILRNAKRHLSWITCSENELNSKVEKLIKQAGYTLELDWNSNITVISW